MSNGSFRSRAPSSSLDDNVEELEAQRTVGLTRVLPADVAVNDVPDSLAGEGASEARTKFEVRIGSMSNGLDGGQGSMQGEVEITEYVNDEYVGAVNATLSIIVEPDTPLGLVEDRFLAATEEMFKRLAAISLDELRLGLDSTKKDEDAAYRLNGDGDGR